MRSRLLCLSALLVLSACVRADHIGKAPDFTPTQESPAHNAMFNPGLPMRQTVQRPVDHSSLWHSGRRSLLGDRRAMRRGDILTVVIEIDDEAEISNSTQRARDGSESLGVPGLFGIPQRLDKRLPEGASMAEAVSIGSTSSSSGSGSVRRNEKLTLRVAATITQVLPNGVLAVSGSQEVRVNYEMRELLVTGYVRPEDISRRNEVTYDKIASARVSYGGRGQISDMQQPRYGQQILDAVLPF
ncbi:flagellar basal body L-ring protein FlgH [Lutimaribacter sp. EGI FJ00015]|uniref:Flagellar basal body L-ring protein FlgH n=1 Tax=Lutimaribacter degradans TaxID=2945989 RepID=A0ACC5ZV25_9RHOB|nr:flagellar basal body L-ring protein FlgH [Lutimaribacter sp. EGI FJ00013]MCM2561901.1 flagellar basal body L-ring protein FlgH [Lutimaribacter sp. EGI FJ00013]MCO0613067.1 flagellar basal body L-ring protein FlgH [Lutimaribacter sp. EGI FJ00015]MCO0635733.1 flagellar basal body L-ring protein FlgH [Lutimaribacter sp. EGI FJ00014]